MINPDGALRYYPGSPSLAATLLRKQDALRLCELHGTESELLAGHFRRASPKPLAQVGVNAGDGFAALAKLLPPPPQAVTARLHMSPTSARRIVIKTLRSVRTTVARWTTSVTPS